jgi:uncharacterized protein (TIGR02466 family)
MTVENFLTEEQCADIKSFFKNVEKRPHALLEGDGLSTYHLDSDFLREVSTNILSCSNLKISVDEILREYALKSGILHKVIDRSWANIQPKGCKLTAHTHPGSFITGSLYISVPSPTPLIFNNPNPYLKFTGIDKNTKYTEDHITVIPKKGLLVLFPSWLEHCTETSYSEERLVVSFNSGLR